MEILIAPPTENGVDDGSSGQRQKARKSKIESLRDSKGNIAAKEAETLNEVLKLSDFVSVQLPLTASTRGYIGTNELDAMKSSAMLISVGRGGVVNEMELLRALENKDIAGAALDVFENEGPSLCDDKTLMKLAAMDSTIITPHVGGHTEEAQADVWTCVIRNVLDAL